VQNEPEAEVPWDSCLYSAADERDFVRDFLGPELEGAGLGHIRILIWDHNRDHMAERAQAVLSDPAAARFVWGTAFHWYGPECFDEVQAVHDAFPDKHLLFTEGCQEGGPHHGSWEVAERYARNLIHDLNRWSVGWIDWNLLLDHRGGPNHVGNLCSAPLLADASGLGFERQPSYYALGHVARHVRPGACRIHTTVDAQDLLGTAFENPDGSLALVLMNGADHALALVADLAGGSRRLTLPPRSIATLVG
jgi:glucosylceramidase